ncbi:hypothetical protein ACSZND_24065, partial [Aeromonas hydrophila]
MGGKFSHAKTSIEHKRRYAHRFSNPADGKTIVLTIRWNYVWRYYIASEMAASSNLLESKR